MHRFDKCVFYFYPSNWSSQLYHNKSLFQRVRSPSSFPPLPFFLSSYFNPFQVPWFHLPRSCCPQHFHSFLPTHFTCLLPLESFLPAYIHLKEKSLDLANVLIHFPPFTDKFKSTICTQGFYFLPLVLATTWLKHTHQWHPSLPCHRTSLHSPPRLRYQQCGNTQSRASLQHPMLLNGSHLLLPEPRSQTHHISCCLIPSPSHSVSLQPLICSSKTEF